MRVFRLAPSRYPPFDGEGARRFGGRWNSPGVPLVYLSEHLSLCVVETLVHLGREQLPPDLVAYEVELADEHIETLPEAPPGWFADPLLRQTRRYGDTWAEERRSLALRVPSAVIRREYNLLFNALHPATDGVRLLSQEPFSFDPRLGG